MYLDKLKKHNFFVDFPLEQLKYYVDSNSIRFKKYKQGYTLHSEYEPCLNLDIVILGKLNCYNLSEDGNIITMFNFSKNDVIGGNLLFSNKHCYPLNIYCEMDCVVAHINKDIVSKLIIENQTFMFQFIKSISNNSLNMNKKMITFARKNLRQDIIDFLKTQSNIQNSNIIKLDITKKQLADELGVQRPSLFRELKKMKGENLIDYDSKKIIILESNLLSN